MARDLAYAKTSNRSVLGAMNEFAFAVSHELEDGSEPLHDLSLWLPIDAFVIGEPVRVAAIEYSGNARRGLVAVCRHAEYDYQVNLADVLFDEGSAAEKASTAYRAWLGLPPHTPAEHPARRHKADPADLDLSRDIELVVLASKANALRCRVLGTQREVTLRTAVRNEIPGEIISVAAAKQWSHGGHPYISGAVKKSRLDVEALGLAPLELRAEGDWDPDDEFWGEGGDPLPAWAKAIIAKGKRPAFEMGQVIPGADPDDPDTDPIIEAGRLVDSRVSEAEVSAARVAC